MVVDKGWTEGIADKESDEGRERDGVEVGKVSEWEVGWEGKVGKVIDGDEEILEVREGTKGLRSNVEAVDPGEEEWLGTVNGPRSEGWFVEWRYNRLENQERLEDEGGKEGGEEELLSKE